MSLARLHAISSRLSPYVFVNWSIAMHDLYPCSSTFPLVSKQAFDDKQCAFTDFSSPIAVSVPVKLAKLMYNLMIRWHMLFISHITPFCCGITPIMACHAKTVFIYYLYCCTGGAQCYLFFMQRIWYRIIKPCVFYIS